jgi:hypothetical protein
VLTFNARVRLYSKLDRFVEQAGYALDALRGLGVESRGVKGLAVAKIVVGLVKPHVSPHAECTVVNNTSLQRIASALFQPKSSGWNQYGSTWVWLESNADGSGRPTVEGHTSVVGGESALWREVKLAFAEKFPAALLADSRQGLRVTADRPNNVRELTSTELELAERIRGYALARVPVSVLLYGPQGSAKTTAACSIANLVAGSYFRLSADHVERDVIHALVDLRPPVVIVDDIDRVGNVSLLELLDALAGAGVIVMCTSNTAPDTRHGDDPNDLMDAALCRSGRMDIHFHVTVLSSEAHAQICRAQGLASIDLGPRAGELLASDLATLGRMRLANDLPDPIAAVDDLLQRRTNKRKVLRAVPTLTDITASKL